jgi:hypothetical protein
MYTNYKEKNTSFGGGCRNTSPLHMSHLAGAPGAAAHLALPPHPFRAGPAGGSVYLENLHVALYMYIIVLEGRKIIYKTLKCVVIRTDEYYTRGADN